jgi:hypothetical protein
MGVGATTLDNDGALPQSDWVARPTIASGVVCRRRHLNVVVAADVVDDGVAAGIPAVDPVVEVGLCDGHRHEPVVRTKIEGAREVRFTGSGTSKNAIAARITPAGDFWFSSRVVATKN